MSAVRPAHYLILLLPPSGSVSSAILIPVANRIDRDGNSRNLNVDMASIAKLKGWNIGRRRWSPVRCGRARVDCTGHFDGIGRANFRVNQATNLSFRSVK